MRAIVIVNEKAGTLAISGNGSPFSLDALRAALVNARLDADVRLCPPGAVQDCVRRAVAASDRPGAIVIGGGDGTLSCAAGVLAGTNIPFGILPLGTLNHFAKDLGVPDDLEGCVHTIAAGNHRMVDVAEVNGRIYINNCSIGAYPAAVQRRDMLRRRSGLGKWRAMLQASIEILRELRRLHVHIELDGETIFRRTPFVLVSNNRYSGQVFSRQLRPRLDEGRLCTYVTRAHRFAPLLRLAWRTLTTGIDRADGLESRMTRQVTIALGEMTPAVATDGEVFNVSSPLRFRIHPAALRVLAPATPEQR